MTAPSFSPRLFASVLAGVLSVSLLPATEALAGSPAPEALAGSPTSETFAAPTWLKDIPSKAMTLRVKSVNGSGCKKNTAVVAVSPDNQAFTVTYSSFRAYADKNSKELDAVKNCQLGVEFAVPTGYSFSVFKVDYRGYAKLTSGVKGHVEGMYYIQGKSGSVETQQTIDGAYNDDWQFSEKVPDSELQWSKCGGKTTVNMRETLQVEKSEDYSELTGDSIDGSGSAVLAMKWRRC